MTCTVFVVGLDDFNLAQLRSIRNAERYDIRALFRRGEITRQERFSIADVLDEARRRLAAHGGPVDAIVGYFDFPTSTILPILREMAGLPTTSLESVLRCEHKYWSRLIQRDALDAHVPRFCAVNPFADDPRGQVTLPYPFWLKPVKGHSSILCFFVHNDAEFRRAIAAIRADIDKFAAPFDEILARAELPPAVAGIGGQYCIAEEPIARGSQCTLEGYVYDGDVVVYGAIDSIREGRHRSCFARYQYPSRLPRGVIERMAETTRKVMRPIGLDNCPFNIEYFYDRPRDAYTLLEINPRISKSHSPLFQLVTGASHHEVMLELALGERPQFPRNQGRYPLAAKFMLRLYADGVVARVPDAADIARARRAFPGTMVETEVRPGVRLSELSYQDSYSYEIAAIYMGAHSQRQLLADYRRCLDILGYRVEPVDGPAPLAAAAAG